MKIAIVGAGVMGCIYGGPLSLQHEVLLVDVVKEHVDAINERGLELAKLDGRVEVYHPKATMDTAGMKPCELLILLCKGYQSEAALEKNKSLIGPDTIVLSLQNGHGNADAIAKFVDEEQIILGTSAHGGIMERPGHVFHAGSGPTHVGCLTEEQTKAELVARILSDAGLPEVSVTADVEALVWSKLFVNVGINPITALLDDTNQCIANNEFARAASHTVVYEAVQVANAAGMSFDFEKVFENVIEIALGTGPNRSSMLADVSNKRLTEIDRINGAVVSEGAKVGMEAPLNKLLTDMIHAKEETY